MAWVCLLLLAVSAFGEICTWSDAVSINFPAVIESPDGQTPPLEFLVGSDVVLTCRVKEENQIKYDAYSLSMVWRPSSGNTSQRSEEDVTHREEYVINTTSHDVTEGERVYYCNAKKRESGKKTTLVSATVRMGYPPSDKFSLHCELFPKEVLNCCLVIKDPRSLQHNPALVKFSVQSDGMAEKFPDPCVAYDADEIPHSSPFTIHVNASNRLGFSVINCTFRPIEEVNPGPMHDLQALNLSNPHQLGIQWRLAWSDMYSSVCFDMGGLRYDVTVQSLHPDVNQSFTWSYSDDGCVTKGQMNITVDDLVPNTPYNITVIARGPRHLGSPRSVKQTTSESAPLTPSTVTAFAYSDTAGSGQLALYLKKYAHREKGGDIKCYNVCVNSNDATCNMTSFRVTDVVQTSDRQLVTTPSVLTGCHQGCDIRVSASTDMGPSPETRVHILDPSDDISKGLSVYVENDVESTSVSWEGSSDVTSVHWCFGPPFSENARLIRCLTEVQTKEVEANSSSSQVTESKRSENNVMSVPCENCNWHFAVGVTSYNMTRLVWAQCYFQLGREAPEPKLEKISVSSTSIEVRLVWNCDDRPQGSSGRPLASQVTYCPQSSDCSEDHVTFVKNPNSGQQWSFGHLKSGHNYSICVRLNSTRGWGKWTQIWAVTQKISDDVSLVPMAAALGVVCLTVLVIVILLVRHFLKRRYGRYYGATLLSIVPTHRKNRHEKVIFCNGHVQLTAAPQVPARVNILSVYGEQHSDSAFQSTSNSTSASSSFPESRSAHPDTEDTFRISTWTHPSRRSPEATQMSHQLQGADDMPVKVVADFDKTRLDTAAADGILHSDYVGTTMQSVPGTSSSSGETSSPEVNSVSSGEPKARSEFEKLVDEPFGVGGTLSETSLGGEPNLKTASPQTQLSKLLENYIRLGGSLDKGICTTAESSPGNYVTYEDACKKRLKLDERGTAEDVDEEEEERAVTEALLSPEARTLHYISVETLGPS